MKLALNGQWSDVSGMIYAYPDKLPLASDSKWADSIFDPRVVREMFKGDYCYAIWFNENGYYYSCIKTNADSRNGCVMLTLFAGEKVSLVGKKLIDGLRDLLDYCLSKNNHTEIDNMEVAIKARRIEELLTERALPELRSDKTSTVSEKGKACRLYKNEDDLGVILENPNQIYYADYKCIFLFEESKCAVNSDCIIITEPVKKTYDIRSDSNDVRADKSMVMKGDNFKITYKKNGYVDECRPVCFAEEKNKYFDVDIDGGIINLKSAAVAEIKFMREIILEVVDEENNKTIERWNCKGDCIIKEENHKIMFDPQKPRKIVISADCYDNKTVELPNDGSTTMTVKLNSFGDDIQVILQDGKKKHKGNVRVKSNSDLYKPLKEKDGKAKILQEKRPFFSRRNLVPILAVFAVAVVLGLFLGKSTKKPMETKVVELQKDMERIEKEKESLNDTIEKFRNQIVELENELNHDGCLISSFCNVLKLVKDKNAVNPEKVKKILSNDKIDNLPNEKDENKKGFLEELEKKLKDIKDKEQKKENSEEKDLQYFTANKDVWDLSEIKSEKYKKLVEYIKKADIKNMKDFSENKKIKNENWEKIVGGLNKLWEKAEKDRSDTDKTPTKDQQDPVKGKCKKCLEDKKFDVKKFADYLENYTK